jgi:4-diphosphocytidyl-2-C-methyl-D-erythritol kinase
VTISAQAPAETAYAKINLALHVRRRRADGYHNLETLFAFCADGDELTAEAAEDLSLTIDGPFGAGLAADDDNLVLRAARALRDAARIDRGAAIHLDKRLPIASGIGGGSADAAAAIRLLSRLWAIDLPHATLHAIAADLGADVPACLVSKSCRGEGKGDTLELLDDGALAGLPVLLVNPRVAVPTGPVFQGWDGIDRGALSAGEPLMAARAGRNDLEPIARTMQPAIAEVMDVLSAMPGKVLARMSGSGATCFALFKTPEQRDEARDVVADRFADWWTFATMLR